MTIRVTLLDGLTVVDEDAGKTFELALAGHRSQTVFASLVLAGEAPLLRRDLAFAIWGEERPAAWASALRSAVSGVRRAVWGCQALAGSRLVTLADAYRLQLPDQTDVDVLELLALVAGAQVALTADPTTAMALAAHCGTCATAVFLPGVSGAWVESWRARLRAEVATALCVEAEAALLTRYPSRALRAARGATGLEPFDESGQLLLVRSLVANGDRPAAVRAYHAYRRSLADELGLEPGTEVQEAYLAVLRNRQPAVSTGDELERPTTAGGDQLAAAQSFRAALDELDPSDLDVDEQRLELLLGLSDAANRTGSQWVAHRLCFQAAALARRLARPEYLAQAALTLGGGAPPWLDHDHRAIVGLLREALDAAQRRPDTVGAAVAAQLRSRLASWGIWSMPRDACRQLSDDALHAARQAGQPAGLIAVLIDRGLTLPRRLEDVLVSEQAGAALMTEFGAELDPQVRFLAVSWLADGQLLRADATGTALALGDLAALADRCDLVGLHWRVTATRAMTAVVSGDLTTGERLAARAREVGQDLPGAAIAGVHLCQLLVIRWLQGRVGELVAATEAMAEQTPEIDWHDVLAWVYAENGQLATARRLLVDLDPARFTSERAAHPWMHWATNLAGFSRACALVGSAESAAALYHVYAEQADYAMTATTVVFYGVVDHALADLAQAAGWHSRAEQHRRRALATYRRMPAPQFVAATAMGRQG